MVLRGAGAASKSIAWPSTWAERMAPLSKVRALTSIIRKELAFLFPHTSFQEALSPFDLDYWPHGGSDNEWDLLAGCFGDLAAARTADINMAISGYLRVRPLAAEYKRRGDGTVICYWGKANRDRSVLKSYPAFAALAKPAFAQFLGNGELEGDFGRIAHVGVNSRPGDVALKRAWIKVLIDGPRPDSISDEWYGRVQGKYVEMFGQRDMAKVETSAKQTGGLFDARHGVKRPSRQRGKAEQERKRRRQLADLSTAGAASERECIFGDAPSAADAASLAAEPGKLLEASSHRTAVLKLTDMAEQHAEKLVADRLPASNPALQDLVRKYRAKEDGITAARSTAVVSNPKLDLEEGRYYVPMHKRSSGRGSALLFAPT